MRIQRSQESGVGVFGKMVIGQLTRGNLHVAAEENNRILLKTLLAAGEDPNVLDNDNFSPLLYAVRHRHFHLAADLLSVISPIPT